MRQRVLQQRVLQRWTAEVGQELRRETVRQAVRILQTLAWEQLHRMQVLQALRRETWVLLELQS